AALGRAPDLHLIPGGNAGNITSYWRGYREYRRDGVIDALPRMFGFQAQVASPLVKGHPVDDPRTIATAIRIGNPASWDGARSAAGDSGGGISAVRDKDILEAYRLVARDEGLFCELASAASVAGLLQLHASGALPVSGRHDVTHRCFRDASAAGGAAAPPVRIEVVRSYPPARGLGASAAAIVAGLVGARAAGDLDLPDSELARLAIRVEGHADNVL